MVPGWIDHALLEMAATPEHQADMGELATCIPWSDGPLIAVITDRIRMRQLRAAEMAGARYQQAYEEWRLRCATTRDGS